MACGDARCTLIDYMKMRLHSATQRLDPASVTKQLRRCWALEALAGAARRLWQGQPNHESGQEPKPISKSVGRSAQVAATFTNKVDLVRVGCSEHQRRGIRRGVQWATTMQRRVAVLQSSTRERPLHRSNLMIDLASQIESFREEGGSVGVVAKFPNQTKRRGSGLRSIRGISPTLCVG